MIRRPFRGPVGCVYSMSFGQQLRGDFQRFSGPGLAPSPGRLRLTAPLTPPHQRLGRHISGTVRQRQGRKGQIHFEKRALTPKVSAIFGARDGSIRPDVL